MWKPWEGPSSRTGGKGATPSRERPFAAPETPKNADRKKDSLALYGLPEAHKTRRIKKDFVTTVSPHPVEAQGNAPETGGGKYFQLWRSDRVGGTAFLISVGVWGAPLPAAFVNSMLYNVLYKCDAGESHNSKGALWWERTLGLPFFANRSGRVTASRGFPGPLSLVFVWSLFWPLVFTQQARAEKIDPQKPAYFLVFSRDEKPVKI